MPTNWDTFVNTLGSNNGPPNMSPTGQSTNWDSFVSSLGGGQTGAPAPAAPVAPAASEPTRTPYTGLGGVFAGNPTPSLNNAPVPGMGDVQAAGLPPQPILRAATSADQPSPSWWQNALGAVKKFNDLIISAVPGGQTNAQDAQYAAADANTPGLPAAAKAAELGESRLFQSRITPDNAGSQMVQNSPLASGAARVVGGLLPWVASAATAPGVGADTAGLGAEDMGNLPLWQQVAGMAGRGVAQGAGANVLQGIDPTSHQGLQNEALGVGMDVGAGLVGKAGEALNVAPIISRPVGGAVGGAAGTAAGYSVMTPQEQQSFGKSLVSQGLTMGAVELVMTALGGKAAFTTDGEATPTESQEAQQEGAGAEQPPVQGDSLRASVTENIGSIIDDMEPAEEEALSTAVANNDADGALGIVAGKMKPPVNTGGAQTPNDKLILTLKAIFSDEQPARIGGAQTDIISKLKAIDQGTYTTVTMQQNNEIIAKLKAIMDSSHAHNIVQNAASQTVQQDQDDQQRAGMDAAGASQNVPADTPDASQAGAVSPEGNAAIPSDGSPEIQVTPKEEAPGETAGQAQATAAPAATVAAPAGAKLPAESKGTSPTAPSANHTPAELSRASKVLSRYREVAPGVLKSTWDAFPELRDKYPHAGKFLDKQPPDVQPKSLQSWAADMKARGADQNVPGPPQAAPDQVSPQGSNTKGMIGNVGGAGKNTAFDKAINLPTEMPSNPAPEEDAQAKQLATAQNQKLKEQAVTENIDPKETAKTMKNLNNSGKPHKPAGTVDEWIHQKPRDIYRFLVNKNLAFDTFTKNLEKKLDLQLSDRNNPATQAGIRMYSNQRALTNLYIEGRGPDGKILSDVGGNPLPSLASVLDMPKEDVKDWEDYLTAKRAVYKVAKGQAVYPKSYGLAPADEEDTASVDSAKEALDKVKDDKEDPAIIQTYQDAYDKARENVKEINKTSSAKVQAIIDEFEKQHPDFKARADQYYSWNRTWGKAWMVDTGLVSEKTWANMEKGDPAYTPFYRVHGAAETETHALGMRFTGSERPLQSHFYAIQDSILRTTRRAMDNKLSGSVYNDLQQYPKEVNELGIRLASDPKNEMAAREAGTKAIRDSDEMHEDPAKAMGDETDEKDREEEDQFIQKHGNTWTTRVNGKAVAMKIDNTEMRNTVRHLAPEQVPSFLRVVSRGTHLASNLQAGFNTFFTLLKQPAIEQPGYFLTSKTINQLNPVDWARYPFQFVKAFGEVMKGNFGNDTDDLAEFKALGGGKQGFSGNQDTFEDLNPAKRALGGKVSTTAKQIITKVNTTLTNTARLAEFKRQLASGAGTEKAFAETQALGINFGRHGEFQFGNIGGMFVNAGIQGVDAMARSLISRPAQTIGGAIALLTVGQMLTYGANRNNPYYVGDPKRNIPGLSQSDKDNYYCVPDYASRDANGIPNKFIKIEKPKAWGLLFSTIPEHIITAIDKQDPKQLDDWYGQIGKVLLPLDVSTIFDPLFQVWANKSYSGGPIVSQKLSSLSPGLQGDKSDTAAANWLGGELNKTPLRGYSAIAPKNIDYLAQSYGGVLTQVLNPAKTLQTDLIADPSKANDVDNNFYNLKTKLDQSVADFKQKGVKSKDYNPGLAKSVDKVATQMGALTKAIQNVQGSKTLSQAQKDQTATALKQRQQQIMQQIIQRVGGLSQ